ncbi:MAG: hypothetical protein OXE75_14285 [bacterium]|nr:hypothetical protein [bacterium]
MALRIRVPASAGTTKEGGDAGGRPAERFRQTLTTAASGGADRTPADQRKDSDAGMTGAEQPRGC